MKRRTAFPFLTLPDGTVSFTGWMLGDPGYPLQPAGDILEGWDYERDLEVSAGLKVDFRLAAEALGVSADDLRLGVVLRTGTGAGTLPRRFDMLATGRLSSGEPETILSGVLNSSKLSGRLRLDLGIVLQSASVRQNILSPAAAGARLWSRYTDVLLEDGGDSRFPIELVSFGECFRGMPHVHAPWYVDWKPGQVHADFGGSVRLYVNSDIPEIADRFVSGDPLTLQAMLSDVMSQMVESTIALEDAEDLMNDCAEGSVGHQVRGWLDLAFPGQSILNIRSISEHTPGRFRAALLSASDLGEAA